MDREGRGPVCSLEVPSAYTVTKDCEEIWTKERTTVKTGSIVNPTYKTPDFNAIPFFVYCLQAFPTAHTRMDWIDYRSLPASSGGFSELFLDFIDDFPRVARFYPQDYRDFPSYAKVMKAIDQRSLDRRTLAGVLREQNASYGAPPRAMEQIQLLEKQNAYAVVTGQQVGLFGGPLYTVFKTITAVKLAARLKEAYPRADFVPVFWLEGEDHDFAEMNHAGVLDRENSAVRVQYLPAGEMPERNMGAVGEHPFDGSLDAAFTQLSTALQKTEFTEALLQRLHASYAPGTTFNRAFASWMSSLFAESGLIFISSNDPRLKKCLSPLFEHELSEYPATSQLVITQSAELEKEYHAQVKPRSINLFMFHKGGRYLIEPRENDFSLKGTRHFISKDEMMRIARETPELLSPNVVLRPIAQDTLLPTVAYVAGPSEIAYQAQLKPVYERAGIPQPVIYPRASASFIEERLRRALERYELDVIDFFGDIGKVTERVVQHISEVKLDLIFGTSLEHIHDSLNELKFGLKEVDPTLIGALDNAKGKIDTTIDVLREKAVAAQKRRNETAVRQIEKAANGLLPSAGLQERELSILYLLNKYGPDVMNWTLERLDIAGYKHQVLTL